jgi:hypothetical protein
VTAGDNGCFRNFIAPGPVGFDLIFDRRQFDARYHGFSGKLLEI